MSAGGVPSPNYTQVPNRLLDDWLPEIDSLPELKVALAIVRATAGWHKRREVLSLSRLQHLTGLRRESVVDGLRRAHKRGYVEKHPVGQGFAYGLVVEGEVVRSADQLELRAGSGERTTASPVSGPVGSPVSGPQIKKGGKKPSGGKKDDTPTSGDPRPCPGTVDRKVVGSTECAAAWLVMDAFNAKAGTRCRAKGFVEKIIRRMREHPELGVADHEAVIAAVLDGTRWWTGTPDPAIVYGSDEQFERCLNQRSAAVPGRVSVQSGRDWDEGLGTGE